MSFKRKRKKYLKSIKLSKNLKVKILFPIILRKKILKISNLNFELIKIS